MPSRESSNCAKTSDQRHGSFFLQLEFKKDRTSTAVEPLDIEPQHIKQFTITLDINRLLPSFKFVGDDAAGVMTHVLPFDHNQSKFHVQLGSFRSDIDETTLFSFDIYRRFPTSNFIYDIEGMLDVNNLFAPSYTRAFNGTIKSAIETIGAELGVHDTEISSTLDYEKTILQPEWSNAKMLTYLKKNVIGSGKEAAFYCFIKCVGNKNILVFKPIKELVAGSVKYRFTLTPEVVKDKASGEEFWPVLKYKFFDNYKYLGISGTRRQTSGYFDYANSQYVRQGFDIDQNENELYDYHSFTKYHSIDNDDLAENNLGLGNLGSNNEFTTDFEGRTLNKFHKNITNLSKLWIDVVGLEVAYPGDMIKVYYLEQTPPVAYQHTGYWMIERVVHIIGSAFVTRLLLTRNGSDPGLESNLIKAKFDRGKT